MNLSRGRFALLALGGLALLAGLVGALVLIGTPMPGPGARLAASHGVLMSLGFLGSLIALERAVALDRAWGYLAPMAAGAGSLALVLGAPPRFGLVLLAVAAAVFVAVYVAFDRLERSLHTGVQGIGALAWLGAAILLASGQRPAAVLPWLAAFLVLTIAGERLELSRLGRLTAIARLGFVVAAGVFCAGVATSTVLPDAGVRLSGIGLVGLALWLARNDLARRTVRMPGVTRFVALSLLAGYAWLAVAGVCWVIFGATTAGAAYDAMIHSLFLGFVISMVFGHAPIILPAVLRLPLPYRGRFYAHLVLLHVGLLLRVVAGDLLDIRVAWEIGGILNVASLLLFMGSSAHAAFAAPRSTPVGPTGGSERGAPAPLTQARSGEAS